ncbi:MAG: flagellar filament capping protein FliD [Deltaproteobacteria bacterium]|nr:flagellar filament capping protein FliD [Deltaproteobacteria bacterium]
MDSINEKKAVDTFPFPYEALSRLQTAISPDIDKEPSYSARSYDNQGRISDVAASLRSKLGYFHTRISSSSFLSDTFSWQVKTAKTSDQDHLLAKAISQADEKDYSLEVDRLATIRTATGKRLDSDDATDFATGTYSYSLTIGSDSNAISIDIDNEIGAPETNRSVLLSIERSINRLGVDVTAELHDKKVRDYNPYRENTYKNVSYLTISSNSTGEDVLFSLSDTSGNLIETMGLDKITNFGQQNQYRLDGVQVQSNANDITIVPGKVSATLFETTDSGKNLLINVKQGYTALADELTQIINDYNKLITWIDDNESVISPSLKTTLFKNLSSINIQDRTLKIETNKNTGNATAVRTDLAPLVNLENKNTIDSDLLSIGLTLNNNGTIDITDGFKTAVSGQLRKVYNALAGTDGFFTKISDAIDTIHGKSENNYVFALNSILYYDANGTDRQSIYKTNSSSIINFFA